MISRGIDLSCLDPCMGTNSCWDGYTGAQHSSGLCLLCRVQRSPVFLCAARVLFFYSGILEHHLAHIRTPLVSYLRAPRCKYPSCLREASQLLTSRSNDTQDKVAIESPVLNSELSSGVTIYGDGLSCPSLNPGWPAIDFFALRGPRRTICASLRT